MPDDAALGPPAPNHADLGELRRKLIDLFAAQAEALTEARAAVASLVPETDEGSLDEGTTGKSPAREDAASESATPDGTVAGDHRAGDRDPQDPSSGQSARSAATTIRNTPTTISTRDAC